MEGTFVGCDDLEGKLVGSEDSGDSDLAKVGESGDRVATVGASVAAVGKRLWVTVGCLVLGIDVGVSLGCRGTFVAVIGELLGASSTKDTGAGE